MNISERDKKIIWHPYTQHKTAGPALAITKAEGAHLYDENGKRYIDAISSWWVNLHGHAHPYIAEKVYKQFLQLEHTIFAGFTHQPAVELGERLLPLLPSAQAKIFYSDNGSTAVEVAIKMSIQYWQNKKSPRNRIIAFKNAYHGDTFGAMSVSGPSAFTAPFADMLFEVTFIDAPVKGKEKASIEQLMACLKNDHKPAAFIFEPLVQGAGGMIMQEASALDEMIGLCHKNQVLTIADEVMTGFYRTGKFFATDYLKNKPDIFCLSKGLTGGVMAMGITSCTLDVFSAFENNDQYKSFFHGHSFTANPLTCAAALASLDLLEKEETKEKIKRLCSLQQAFKEELANNTRVKGVRQLGTILAMELPGKSTGDYFDAVRDEIYSFFINKGILLRPLGNTLYLIPPYCIEESDLKFIYNSITEFVN